MKKNKIVVLAGMALLMVGTILNVHDALNEFGVMEISLHPQVMAQTGTTSGTTTNMGKQLETDVKCTKTTTTSVVLLEVIIHGAQTLHLVHQQPLLKL